MSSSITSVARGRMAFRIAALSAGGLAVLAAAPALAQDATRPAIKIVVPFAAGGGVDVVARIIAPRISEELKQPVIVENRGGAGGMLGASAVGQSAPDGTTFLLGTGSTHGTNSSVYAKLTYDPVKDFVPIVQVTQSPLLLVVPPTLKIKTVKELIALSKGRTDPLNYGSYGPGSINHLGAELLISMSGIRANHVPYRGSAPALVDLIAGRLDFMLDGVSTSIGYVEAGTLILLGPAGTRRTALLPDAPTIAEGGLPGYDTSVWTGLLGPAGTPRAVADLVNAPTNTVLGMAPVKEAFAKLGFEGVGGGPEVLSARIKAELEKWPVLVKEKNIRINP